MAWSGRTASTPSARASTPNWRRRPCPTRTGWRSAMAARSCSACPATGGSARTGARCRCSAATRRGPACAAWPVSTAATSSASGPASWATAARCCWARSDTPAGPMELQLKGGGLTPYSRMGDGRAVLRSSIREFLCSEAMHALGIPTTRALCIDRLAAAGAARDDRDRGGGDPRGAQLHPLRPLRALLRTTTSTTRCARWPTSSIDRYYPALPRRRAALRRAAARRWRGAPPTLMAQWQAVGFCHGVMNTDNMSILGLTHRLRPVRLPRRLRPRPHLQPHRPPGPLRLRAPAERGVLEPACAGAGAAAADRRPATTRAGRARALQDARSPTRCWSPLRAKLGLRQAQDGDRELVDDLLRLHGRRPQPTSRSPSAAWAASPATTAPQRRRARPVHRPRGLRRLGRALCRSGCAPKAATTPSARAAHEPRQPEVRAAQPPGRRRDPPGARGRLRRSAAAAAGAAAPVRRAARARRPMPASRPTGRNTSKCPVRHEYQARPRRSALPGAQDRRRMARRSSTRCSTRWRAMPPPSAPSPASTGTTSRPAATTASAAARRCSSRPPSSTPAAAGRATAEPINSEVVERVRRQQPRHGARRGALQQLRLAPRPRLRRRPGAHRRALLHQLGRDRLRPTGLSLAGALTALRPPT